jgi:hypothetical protein
MCKLTTKVAKMAEKCYHFEIGDVEMGNAKSFIGNSYWDGAYSGLLSADRLIADLHAMEVAYLENDKNELEITRDIYFDEITDKQQNKNYLSILQNDYKTKIIEDFPFTIYEDSFDKFDHYFKRIRNVQLKVILNEPKQDDVALNQKPKRRINIELSLTENKLYLNKSDAIQNRVGVQTIATSIAHQDANQFFFDFKNEKYRPFEGAGLDSSWKLTIPEITGDEVSNVIMTVSYTARKGAQK